MLSPIQIEAIELFRHVRLSELEPTHDSQIPIFDEQLRTFYLTTTPLLIARRWPDYIRQMLVRIEVPLTNADIFEG